MTPEWWEGNPVDEANLDLICRASQITCPFDWCWYCTSIEWPEHVPWENDLVTNQGVR